MCPHGRHAHMPMRRAEPDRARVKRRAACFIDNEGVSALDAERCRRRVGVRLCPSNFTPRDTSDSLHSVEGSAETEEQEAKAQRAWRNLNNPLLTIKIIVFCRRRLLLLLPACSALLPPGARSALKPGTHLLVTARTLANLSILTLSEHIVLSIVEVERPAPPRARVLVLVPRVLAAPRCGAPHHADQTQQ